MLEFGLYAEDVARAADFYARIFGFRALLLHERVGVLDIEGRQILLLFKHGAAAESMELPGGVLPPHDGEGTSHLAFAIQKTDIVQWEAWLREQALEIESKVIWEKGGQSFYFRDLDGHLLELATPGIWETY